MDVEQLLAKAKNFLMVSVGFMYVLMGAFTIVKEWFLTNIDTRTAWLLGIVLIAYGIFRIIRAFKIIKKESSN